MLLDRTLILNVTHLEFWHHCREKILRATVCSRCERNHFVGFWELADRNLQQWWHKMHAHLNQTKAKHRTGEKGKKFTSAEDYGKWITAEWGESWSSLRDTDRMHEIWQEELGGECRWGWWFNTIKLNCMKCTKNSKNVSSKGNY